MKTSRAILYLTSLLLAPAALLSAAQGNPARPNVLFIAVDDLRPEISCYGNPVVKTPNIDRIAARGTTSCHVYWDLYDPDKIPLPATDHLPDGAPVFAGHNNGELHSYANVPAGNPIPAAFARTLRHGYYTCVSYTDAQVGRLLGALEKEGLADNTVIVFWGDHGWQLGDHGLWHKHTNFELATRAPLLISLPGQKAAGQRCDAVVEFVDIYPTLAMANQADPEAAKARFTRWDTDKDGFLSRDEFIFEGGKAKETPNREPNK